LNGLQSGLGLNRAQIELGVLAMPVLGGTVVDGLAQHFLGRLEAPGVGQCRA
jgi:hypothetical protein